MLSGILQGRLRLFVTETERSLTTLGALKLAVNVSSDEQGSHPDDYTVSVPEIPQLRHTSYGPLARYVKLRFSHAPGMPGTFSPLPLVSYLDMHHGTCVTHVP